MASVSLIEFSVVWINPGSTHHTWWNNAPSKRVYAFSATPVAHESGAVAKMEVTKEWQRNNFDTGETEVHVIVTNIGSFGGYCYIFMSVVAP
jgi:hypothetical protein